MKRDEIMDQWNPLLIQLETAAEHPNECSSLVLQSLVAQSAKVLSKLKAENDALREANLNLSNLARVRLSTDVTDSTVYVSQVADHCDRIVWRGHYYHLPLETKGPQ